jgi:tRNA pseudouridine38-40 synthase
MSLITSLFPKLAFPDKYNLLTIHPPKRNIRLVLQYRGSAYQGWQKQAHGLTIQEIVEKCLSKITNEYIKVKASGRTDAGVHALMQVINFFTHSPLAAERLKCGLNSLLPSDIAVLYIDEVNSQFDARFCAKAKTYMYLILKVKEHSPFLDEYSWHIRKPLDINAMQKASYALIGKHDFNAFMAKGSSIKTTTRSIFRLDIKEIGPFIIVEIEANGFLRHMVRNIVGTLVEISLHKREQSEIESFLTTKDHLPLGINVPARGLFLKEVRY